MKTNILIKSFLSILTVILLLSSCKKEEFVPYKNEETPVDTAKWQTTYTNGGTLPGGTTSQQNPLVGTKWVLTKLVTSFATEYPNDTIYFYDNTHYFLNQNAYRSYTLSMIPSSTNYELTLKYFMPFGGSHYSANVGYYFVSDGEINNAEFTNIQNTTSTVRAWFVKIN